MLAQALGKLEFGKKKMQLSWMAIISFGVGVLVSFDYLLGRFETQGLEVVYVSCLIHIVVFNLAIVFDLYERTQLWNRLEHAYGGLIMMSAVYVVLGSYPGLMPAGGVEGLRMLMALGITALLTVMVEVLELGMDKVLKTDNIGPSKYDTNWDLFMNQIGASIFIVLITLAG